MYKSISFYDFERAFSDMDRGDSYSRAGLQALYDFFEELEDDAGQGMELDVIAICCDFDEYDAEELAQQFDHIAQEEGEDPADMDLEDWARVLNEHTICLVTSDDSIVLQSF